MDSEYLDTWKATIMLVVSKHRGRGVGDLCRYAACSTTTFRKYVDILISEGEICCLDYGNSYNPDNRYYVISDATRQICEPVQSMAEWVSEKMQEYRSDYYKKEMGTKEAAVAWEKLMTMREVEFETYRRLDLLQRLAVRIGNT